MERHYVTTPFGRRTMTLAMVAGQLAQAAVPAGKSVDKWKVFRDLCDARPRLGLRDRALAVLSALLSFFPDTQLEEGANLIVFPSNAQLSVRANGIAGTTLRENLGLLVERGLILRKDSPNGKRYARKTGQGDIREAYGFSLAPLLARAEEFAALAQDVAEERRHVLMLREHITILRRDIRKLLLLIAEEGTGDLAPDIETDLVTVLAGLARKKAPSDLEDILAALKLLHSKTVKALTDLLKSQNCVGNDAEIRAHIQDSHTDSLHEFEAAPEMTGKEMPEEEPVMRIAETMPASDAVATATPPPLVSIPLSMVTKACPEIRPYGPQGEVQDWRELMSAATVVRSMLQISPSAYQDACAVMGAQNAATVLACILERAPHIQSPGGYLRSLTRRAAQGKFTVGPMLMAAARNRGVALAALSPPRPPLPS